MPTTTPPRRVHIKGIRRGRAKHAPADSPRHTYAVALCASTGELLISATLDYILDKIEERGWEIVSMSTEPWVPRATDPETAAAAEAVAEVIAAAVDAAAQGHR